MSVPCPKCGQPAWPFVGVGMEHQYECESCHYVHDSRNVYWLRRALDCEKASHAMTRQSNNALRAILDMQAAAREYTRDQRRLSGIDSLFDS